MEALQVHKRELLDTDWDFIIAHELFHQWFGDLVTCESWSNLPLNESFANYSEYLWMEHRDGTDAADMGGRDELEQYLAEAEYKQEKLIRYHYNNREDMFDSHSYAKGGRTLHMLRNYVGDDAFFASLKLYLETHKYTSVEIHDLRLAFEEVTGQDLNWFFDQWFLSAGHPELLITDTYSNGAVKLKVVQMQDTAYTPLYKLPVKVTTYANGKPQVFNIMIDEATETFTLPVATRPNLVLFDSDYQLLAVTQHDKTSSQFVQQFKLAEKGMYQLEALEMISDAEDSTSLAKIAQEALTHPFAAIREEALDAISYFSDDFVRPYLTTVKAIAIMDKKSDVRAAALDLLTAHEPQKYTALFEKALNDSSYRVVASAIQGYLASGATDAKSKISSYDKIQNASIKTALAQYYASFGDADKFSWFQEGMQTMKGQDALTFVPNFGVYLMSHPDQIPEGLKFLEDQARNSSSIYMKFASFQTMSLFSQALPEVKNTLKDIRRKETNEMLNTYYDMYVPLGE